MKTLQKQTSANGEDESTFSLADFRVSHSVMPGSDAARRMTATSGRTCSAALTRSDPIGSLLRTLLESSRWSSKARFLRWQVQPTYSTRSTIFEDTDCARPLPCNASATTLKVTDMPSSRCLFWLVPLEHPTDATESSSSEEEMLPTPTARDLKNPSSPDGERIKRKKEQGWTIELNDLAGMGLLPTPIARCWKGGSTEIRKDTGKVRTDQLDTFVQVLAKQVRNEGILPTPVQHDVGRTNPGVKKVGCGNTYGELLPDLVHRLQTEQDVDAGKAFRLSPLFTEEMMGFPLMWTALPFLSESGAPKPSKPTATPSSRK